MFKRFQELQLSYIFDGRDVGDVVGGVKRSDRSRESSLLGREIDAIDINSTVTSSTSKRKPIKIDSTKRKRLQLSLKEEKVEDCIDFKSNAVPSKKTRQLPMLSTIVAISQPPANNEKFNYLHNSVDNFLLTVVINPPKIKQHCSQGTQSSHSIPKSPWELCIDTYPILPEDSCFVNKTKGSGKNNGKLDEREPAKLSSSLITLNFPTEGGELGSLTPYVLAFDVVSEDMDIPCPCVLIGWCFFNGCNFMKLQSLTHLTLSPTFQNDLASQIINLDSSSEQEPDGFLWELQSISTITLDPFQLGAQDFIGALVDDGPLVFVIQHCSKEADWDLLTWDVSSNEHCCSKLKSTQKVLGLLSMPDNILLIHTQSTSLTCSRLIATCLTMSPNFGDVFDCGIPSDLVNDLSSAYVTALSFEPPSGISNPRQKCFLKGWLGLKRGRVVSLGSDQPERSDLVEALGLNQGSFDVEYMQPNPQGKGLLVKMIFKQQSKSLIQWAFICSGGFERIQDVALVSGYGALLHILLSKEKQLQVTQRGSLAEGNSSHPALTGAVTRLVSHCQTEAARCADRRTLLLQKARLIQDELVLLQSIGFEFSSVLGPVKQIYPALAPPPTTRSYFHVLESAHAKEVELDPAVGPWLPPSHRVYANCTGFFNHAFVLGQAWMKVRITNLHCHSVHDLDILACFALPGARLETQIYWPSDFSTQLAPNMNAIPVLFLRILNLPANCPIHSAWKHLRVSIKWKEQASERIFQSRLNLPHHPTHLTRPDDLPISPVLLALTWSSNSNIPDRISSLLQLNFGMSYLAAESVFVCHTRCIVVKLIHPSSVALQLRIHGLHSTSLWDFISRLSSLLGSLDNAPLDFSMKFHPSMMSMPAHCNTLKLIKARGPTSDYSALLTYLMAKLYLA